MVLSAPNSVAIASNEDIHLSADGQLSQSAGDSINLSTQKNIIAHAQNKISLLQPNRELGSMQVKGKLRYKPKLTEQT